MIPYYLGIYTIFQIKVILNFNTQLILTEVNLVIIWWTINFILIS